jgi:hypothetical protein
MRVLVMMVAVSCVCLFFGEWEAQQTCDWGLWLGLGVLEGLLRHHWRLSTAAVGWTAARREEAWGTISGLETLLGFQGRNEINLHGTVKLQTAPGRDLKKLLKTCT